MTAGRLGLLARPGEGEVLRPLVRALACEVAVHAAADGRESTALLATSPDALARDDRRSLPAAVWLVDVEQLDAIAPRQGPTVVVTPSAAAADAARHAGRTVLEVAAPMVDDPTLDARWPLVRARWRERESLPEQLIVVVHGAGSAPAEAAAVAPGDDVRSVAVTDPVLDDLLAVAAAVVTIDEPDIAARARAGGAPTVEAERGDLGSAMRTARSTAADPIAASRASAEGVAGARHAGVSRAARALIALLELTDDVTSLEQRVTSRLSELGLPAAGPFRARLHDAFAPFPAPRRAATQPGDRR